VLNKEQQTHFAMRDIASRSRISSFLYLVIFTIVIGFTPFYSDHKTFITVIGFLLLAGTLIRGISAWNFTLFPVFPLLWRLLNGAGLVIQAASWGILSVMSIEYYDWQWTTVVICLSSAAFSAGAVITLSPSFEMIVLFLICMFSPTILVSILGGTEQSIIAALLFTTYFVFLIVAAKRLNNEYLTGLSNSALIHQRAFDLEAKNRELESFTYSVSHDLRAPLRSIDGFSKMLLEDAWEKLESEDREYLLRIRSSAQKMGNLIDDLLQLSRLSRAEYEPRDVDLSQLVESSFEKLRQADPARNIIVEIEPHVTTTGDKALLDIAMSNLVENAWKYSSKKPNAKIRFATQKNDGEVVYYIKDNGEGFDTRYMDKLFGPFQRLHTADEFPGTGIGLATVRRIIDRHGGKIWANAKVGRGATFYFTIHRDLQ